MTDKVYQVGVIGYGLSAKVFQIPFFSAVKGFAIGAIVQRSGDDAARENLRVKVYRSADQLFGDPDIDVVVVSTPPSSHFSHVSSALHSGKHGRSTSRMIWAWRRQKKSRRVIRFSV